MSSNIFLTGFSGAGKSVVGREVARLLGWRFADTDQEIVNEAGKPIADIFSDEGEPFFREMEQKTLEGLCQSEKQVVSTGGGMVTDQRNRQLMEASGVIICLEATPDTIYRRLLKEEENVPGLVIRPLLTVPNPLERIRNLKAQRQPDYAAAHWTVHTDHLSALEASQEVIRGWRTVAERSTPSSSQGPQLAAVVKAPSGSYPIWVGRDLLDSVGQKVRDSVAPAPTGAYIISDEAVHTPALRVQVSLETSGIPTHEFNVPRGEQSKTLGMAQHIYEWLASLKAERCHLIVAMGGGVVGDLAGFVAATFLRGVPFVHVPTSLAAMVDASIGGKVAVNLPEGKNLVGAFYQPSFVLAEVATLETLPRRELLSGWAEAIKHGLILDEGLLATFENHAEKILALEGESATQVIGRSVAIKAGIVSQDERETLGLRILLNYGHTIGHALETATDYQRLLHGEAVSIGMMGAAYISREMGLLSSRGVQRQRAILERFGLPLSCPDVDLDLVQRAMLLDKKTSAKSINWVLLEDIGKAVVRADVPAQLVQKALHYLAK